MESYHSPREDLREAERAEAAPFVDYPRPPSWYPVGAGAWAAALLALEIVALDGNQGAGTRVAAAAGLVVLIIALGAFVGWYRAQWGTWPAMRRAPREIRGAYIRFMIGLLVVVGLTAVTWFALGPWWSVGVLFVLVAGGLALYERAYARAAARTRERLA